MDKDKIMISRFKKPDWDGYYEIDLYKIGFMATFPKIYNNKVILRSKKKEFKKGEDYE